MPLNPFSSADRLDPWFIDKDDGTLIHLYFGRNSDTPCGDDGLIIAFEQNEPLNSCEQLDSGEFVETDCGSFVISVPAFRLEVDPPLPVDFSFQSGSISRFSDRLSLFLQEYTPSRVGETPILNTIGSQQTVNLPMKNFISRYDFINTESVGVSTGDPNQTFTVSGDQIKLPTKGTPLVFVGGPAGEKWHAVDDLNTAESTGRVFQYNANQGKVTFGDGVHGAIPPEDAELVLRISIRNGGGVWEYAGIVVDQKSETTIGVVKSCRDKVFYCQSKVAMASTCQLTSVHSKLDVIEQTFKFEGTVTRKVRMWSLALGGEVQGGGGVIILRNTGGSGYVDEKEAIAPNNVGLDHRLTGVPVGSVFDSSTHQPVTIGSPYPSPGMSVATHGTLLTPSLFGPEVNSWHPIIEMTRFTMGVETAPKTYRTILEAWPIFEVLEVINFNDIVSDPDPCIGLKLQSNPYYRIAFFTWPEFYFNPSIGIETRASAFGNKIQDTGGSFPASSVGRAMVPVIVPFLGQTRHIQIGDVMGSYGSPLPLGTGGAAYKQHDANTVYGRSSYGKHVPGVTTRPGNLPIKIVHETQYLGFGLGGVNNTTDIEHQIYGAHLNQPFVCEITAEERAVTTLPEVNYTRTWVDPPPPPCGGVALNQSGDKDVRMLFIENYNFNGAGGYPWVSS